MATIKSLKPSFADLTPEDRFALIRETRALRRELKPKPVRQPRSSSTSSKKKAPSMEAMLAAMSPEQAKELFDKLSQRKE